MRLRLALSPQSSPEILELLANSLVAQGKYAEAEPFAVRRVNLSRNQADAWRDLGRIYLAQSKMSMATTSFSRELELREAQIGRDNAALTPVLVTIAAAWEPNDASKAEALLRRAIWLKKDAELPVANEMRQLGRLLLKEKSYLAAARVLTEAIAEQERTGLLDASTAPFFVDLAGAHIGAKNLTEAEKCYRRAIELQSIGRS